MIFVTVGSIDPFDRLVTAVDDWKRQHPDAEQVVVQIGNGVYEPKYCQYVRYLSPTEYRDHFSRASLVVAHAGMGSIITALELQKPIVLMPRLMELGELRNQHQLATIRHFKPSKSFFVAESDVDLTSALTQAVEFVSTHRNGEGSTSARPADPQLITFIRDFVLTSKEAVPSRR